MSNRDTEGIAHEIIEKTLPIAPTLGAYGDLHKAITQALDAKDKEAGECEEADSFVDAEQSAYSRGLIDGSKSKK